MGIRQEILKKYGDRIAADLKKSIPKVTGKTAASIHAEATDSKLDVLGAGYMFALEYGRGPSKGGGKSTPTLFEAIYQWVQDRAIIPKDPKMSQKTLAYFISKKIHTEGSLLHREQKQSMAIQGVIDRIDMQGLTRELAAVSVKEYSSEVIRELKQL